MTPSPSRPPTPATDAAAPVSTGAVWAALVLLLVLVLLPGCTSRGPTFDPYAAPTGNATNSPQGLVDALTLTNRLDPALLHPTETPFQLGPGDRIDIEILGDSTGPTSTFVGPDGRIYFHLLPGLQVWGLTLDETRVLLEQRLARFLRDPRITITLRGVESRRVWVMGRVNTPGLYPLDGPMTVLEAVTKAGGLFTSRFSGTTEELADLHHSFLVRRGQFVPVDFHGLIREGDTTQNVYLEPDDFLYLPSSLSTEIYVLGAVNQPRAVPFKDQVTLVSAIANARGTLPGARLAEVAIVRGSLSQPSIGIVDYRRIVRGEQTDIRLQPRDIVFVPFSPYRSLERYANTVLNTFTRTVAANEGGRAVDPNYEPPGVTIPINP